MAIPSYFKRLFREYVTGEGSSEVANQSPVQSVNSNTGDVTINVPVDQVNGQTGDVTLSASDVNALADTYSAPVQSVNSKTGDVTISAGGSSIPSTQTVQSYSDLPSTDRSQVEFWYVSGQNDIVASTQLSPVIWRSLSDYTRVTRLIPDTPALRVKAEDLTTSYNNGDTISTWADTSGSGNDLAASGDPTLLTNELNGKAVIQFDGTGDHFRGPSLFSGDDSRTVFVVVNSLNTGGGIAGQSGGPESTNNWFVMSNKSDGGTKISVFSNDFDFGGVKTDTYYAIATYDGTTVETFKNGTDGATSNLSLTTNSNDFVVGARDRVSGEDKNLSGAIAEVIVYQRKLTDTERGTLGSYVATEYGL